MYADGGKRGHRKKNTVRLFLRGGGGVREKRLMLSATSPLYAACRGRMMNVSAKGSQVALHMEISLCAGEPA
jgi:hypothetical protein